MLLVHSCRKFVFLFINVVAVRPNTVGTLHVDGSDYLSGDYKSLRCTFTDMTPFETKRRVALRKVQSAGPMKVMITRVLVILNVHHIIYLSFVALFMYLRWCEFDISDSFRLCLMFYIL